MGKRTISNDLIMSMAMATEANICKSKWTNWAMTMNSCEMSLLSFHGWLKARANSICWKRILPAFLFHWICFFTYLLIHFKWIGTFETRNKEKEENNGKNNLLLIKFNSFFTLFFFDKVTNHQNAQLYLIKFVFTKNYYKQKCMANKIR